MNTCTVSLLAALAISGSSGAMAQSAADPPQSLATVAADSVGRWLYNSQGRIIGSVRSLSADGQTAVIMVGAYFQDGSHLATVPGSALFIINSKVTLRNDTAEALNAVRQR